MRLKNKRTLLLGSGFLSLELLLDLLNIYSFGYGFEVLNLQCLAATSGFGFVPAILSFKTGD